MSADDSPTPAPPAGWWRLTALLLVALGLVVTTALLLRFLALLEGDEAGSWDVCTTVFQGGCDAALLGPSARWLGVPLAGWGLAYFGVLGALLVLGWALGETFERAAHRGALALGLAGATVGVALVARGTASGQTPCPLCLGTHAVSLALLLPLSKLQRARWRGVLADWIAAGRYVLGGATADETQARWRVVGFLAAALVGLVLVQWVLVETRVREALAQAPAAVQTTYDAYERATPVAIGLRADDPRLGRADAPVELVVFSSFECPGCRAFAGVMRRLAARFPDDLTLVFKHFPLGARCNPSVEGDPQPHACVAAYAAEAARLQGRFWPLHDRLFEARLRDGDAALVASARTAQVEPAAFDRDRAGPDVEARVLEDARLGADLGVSSTPAIFVNGRRVRPLSEGTLTALIEQLVARARR